MKNALSGHLAQSPLASQSQLVMHRTRPSEDGRMSHHHAGAQQQHPKKASAAAKGSASRAFNYTMHDCYERLKELVPTIPKNKKITRVEILQHVIDYIQDLQSALESHNINVRRPASAAAPGSQSRAPFTSLTPQQNLDMLNGLADLENCDWQRTLLNLTSSTRGAKLHPYETPDSSPEALSTCSC